MTTDLRTTRILLVDDEKGIRKVLGIALADRGYRVSAADCGETALAVVTQAPPAIAIVDIKMPGMDGITLLKEIKRLSPDTEVIMITGHGDMDLAIESLKHEAIDFITKPINEDILEVALKRAAERISLRRQLRRYTHHLEELVAVKSRQLIEAERLAAIGQTVAGLSHSIKNIAGGLTGGAYVVEKGIEQDNPRYLHQGWRMVKGNVDKIARLSLDLLNYAKTARLRLQLCHPNQPAGEVVELMAARAEEEGITLDIRLDDRLEPFYFDPEGIHRVLLNLVANALDACGAATAPNGARTVSLHTFQPADGVVAYRVKDNGGGMDQATQDRLFQTFFTTKGSHGTGIGLMMSKSIIDKHKGRIDVTSRHGRGTDFVVRLPMRREPPLERSNHHQGEP